MGANPTLVLNAQDAAWMLGLRYDKLLGFIQSGMIARKLTLSAVQAFHREFALTREIAWSLTGSCRPQDCSSIPGLLRQDGIFPAGKSTYRGACVWLRGEVEDFVVARIAKGGGVRHRRA